MQMCLEYSDIGGHAISSGLAQPCGWSSDISSPQHRDGIMRHGAVTVGLQHIDMV